MSSKDAGLRIRVERELRESFVDACKGQNRVASEVLRDFMRSFANIYRADQRTLFPASKDECGGASDDSNGRIQFERL